MTRQQEGDEAAAKKRLKGSYPNFQIRHWYKPNDSQYRAFDGARSTSKSIGPWCESRRKALMAAASKLPATVKPEYETTLPAADADWELVKYIQKIAELEAQLKTVLDRESATTLRFDAKMEALEAERDALLDELSACKETHGGCGYWREAAKQRETERDALKAERDELKAKVEMADHYLDKQEYRFGNAGTLANLTWVISEKTRLTDENAALLKRNNWLETGIACAKSDRLGMKAKLDAFNSNGFADADAMAEKYLDAVNELSTLKTQLAAMTEDRNLWRDDHNEDCPNLEEIEYLKAKLDAVVGQEEPQDAWDRAHIAIGEAMAKRTGVAPRPELYTSAKLPYTPPLKAGTD